MTCIIVISDSELSVLASIIFNGMEGIEGSNCQTLGKLKETDSGRFKEIWKVRSVVCSV